MNVTLHLSAFASETAIIWSSNPVTTSFAKAGGKELQTVRSALSQSRAHCQRGRLQGIEHAMVDPMFIR